MKVVNKAPQPGGKPTPPQGRTFTVARRDNPGVAATFNYSDDKWFLLDILRPHEKNYAGTISFSGLESWLWEDAKKYIAHLWLTQSPQANLLQQILVSLRALGEFLPDFGGRPIDLKPQHAKEFVRRYCELERSPVSNQGARRRINNFMAFVRGQYPEVENNFTLVFPRAKTRLPDREPLEQAQSKRVPTEVLAAVIDGCAADLNAYLDAKSNYIDSTGSIEERRAYQRQYAREWHRKHKLGIPKSPPGPKLWQLLGRAIKAQALILAVCVGRRASAICNTGFNVRTEHTEWVNESGQRERGVLIRFREIKVRNVDEDVPCPDAYGELALHAINTAKQLTSELRTHSPALKDYLFLLPAKTRKKAAVLDIRQLNDYLNGQRTGNSGLIQRYGIPCDKITIHNFRATRATNAWLGGLQVHEVAYDLGHVNADMTIRHYIVGRDEDRRRLQECIDKGALSGALEDIMGGREVVQTRLGRRHVEIMIKHGRVLTPNRYGYCTLPSASGPCIRTVPCYIGPGQNGGGCDYHVMSPDALPALEEDKEVLTASISAFSHDPSYKVWLHHRRAQLAVVEKKISEARTHLHRCEGHCPNDGSCNCSYGEEEA